MDAAAITAAIFLFGMIAEGWLLLRNTKAKKDSFVSGAAAVSTILMILIAASLLFPSASATSFLMLALYLAMLFGAMLFAVRFREYVLPTMNEAVSLSLLVLTWYLVLAYAPWLLECFPVQLLLGLPTLGILLLAFTRMNPGPAPRFCICLWSLLLFLAFAFIQVLHLASESSVGAGGPLSAEGLLAHFIAGMISLRVVSYGTMLLDLSPFPNELNPPAKRMRDVRAHALALAERYTDYQMQPLHALLLLLLLGGALFLNHSTRLLPEMLMVNLCFILAAHLSQLAPAKAK